MKAATFRRVGLGHAVLTLRHTRCRAAQRTGPREV